jgi:hypothetical protein
MPAATSGGEGLRREIMPTSETRPAVSEPLAEYVAKSEAVSRFNAQSLEGGRWGETASGERSSLVHVPGEHDMPKSEAVGGQSVHSDGGGADD